MTHHYSRKIALSVLCSMALGGLALANGESVYQLNPVVVTANRYQEPITEAKADISVVTRETLEKQHITNLEEALRTVPGVQFLNYGAPGMNANLSGIRINGSKDIIVLVDGVRLKDFLGSGQSGYIYSAVLNNMANIERIEVLRGGAGVAYGNNGTGGVINIITRKINKNETNINVAVGTFGKKTISIYNAGTNGQWKYNVYGTNNKKGDIRDGSGKLWNAYEDTKSFGGGVTYEFTKGHTLRLAADRTKSDFSGSDTVYNTSYNGWMDQKNITLTHNYLINDRWFHQLTMRRSYMAYNYRQGASKFSIGGNHVYDFLSEQLNFNTENHALVLGFDYSYGQPNKVYTQKVNGEDVKYYPKMRNHSFYVEETWKPIKRLALTYGIRRDRPTAGQFGEHYDTHTSHSYKIAYDLSDKDSIYVSRNEFYVLPDLLRKYDPKYGNAKLQPAYGHTVNVGYTRELSKDSVLTFNWFRSKADRSIGYRQTGDDINTGHYDNFPDAIDRGWNAQWIARLNPNWDITIGWGHLFHHANGDTLERGYYPKDKATISIRYAKDKWEAGIDGFYFIRRLPAKVHRQGWPSNNYGVFNLNLAYRVNEDMKVYVKVENIFNKLWAEHTNVIWSPVSAPDDWYAMPGRSYTLGMEYKF